MYYGVRIVAFSIGVYEREMVFDGPKYLIGMKFSVHDPNVMGLNPSQVELSVHSRFV